MSALRGALAPPLGRSSRRSRARRAGVALPWRALWLSRALVWIAGVAGAVLLPRAPGSDLFDPQRATELPTRVGTLLAAPAARWDAVWYLDIVHHGYGALPARTAFFPLYPLLTGAAGIVVGSDLVAGILVSLAAFGAALVLLHRLALIEVGAAPARAAVLLLAFSPMAFFFSAVYTESLFLLVSVGAVLAARQGRWAAAGALGGLAAATRSTGVLLLVPIVLLFLYGPRADRPAAAPARRWRPRHPPDARLGWAALVPLGIGLYVLYLGALGLDPLTPFHVQGETWHRHFTGPLAGVWDGLRAAGRGLSDLVAGAHPELPPLVRGMSLMLVASVAVGLLALIAAFRRLPLAYGAYAAVSLAWALSFPQAEQPLASFPRYAVVVFPLFLAAGAWAVERRATRKLLVVSGALLAFFTVEFATWNFVA